MKLPVALDSRGHDLSLMPPRRTDEFSEACPPSPLSRGRAQSDDSPTL